MELTAYVNGRFVPLEQAVVHVEDRGFQFADGVYEVIACLGGKFVDLEDHLERLGRSCAAIDLPLPDLDLEALIRQTYHKNPFDHANIYVQITRGVAPRSHLLSERLTPTVVITVRELITPSREKLNRGATGITLADIRWKRCDIKSIALLASVLGKQEAARRGADEAFWLDEDGYLLEGCSTNCFAIIDGKLVTHPLDRQVLGGITRAILLRVARGHGIRVEERPWRLTEPGLSECMMTSTTSAVVPVCRIDGAAIGSGQPGPLTQDLRQWLLDELELMKE